MANRYRFKFYVTARHFVEFNAAKSEIHPHTWEIVLYFRIRDGAALKFNEVEKIIESYFDQYEGKLLNDVAPFDRINPSMENIGQVFFEQLPKFPRLDLIDLFHLVISENPTRSYIVSEHEDLDSLAMKIN